MDATLDLTQIQPALISEAEIEATSFTGAPIPDPGLPLHELLRGMPIAKREAMMRLAYAEIVLVLESAYNAVGFPKPDGKWTPVLCMDLEAARQRVLYPNAPRG